MCGILKSSTSRFNPSWWCWEEIVIWIYRVGKRLGVNGGQGVNSSSYRLSANSFAFSSIFKLTGTINLWAFLRFCGPNWLASCCLPLHGHLLFKTVIPLVSQFPFNYPPSVFQRFVDVSGHLQSFLFFSLSLHEFIIFTFILVTF